MFSWVIPGKVPGILSSQAEPTGKFYSYNYMDSGIYASRLIINESDLEITKKTFFTQKPENRFFNGQKIHNFGQKWKFWSKNSLKK